MSDMITCLGCGMTASKGAACKCFIPDDALAERFARAPYEYCERVLRDNPSATLEEVARVLFLCGCIGCPNPPCECGKNCKCGCLIEPYPTRKRERVEFAYRIAREVMEAHGKP